MLLNIGGDHHPFLLPVSTMVLTGPRIKRGTTTLVLTGHGVWSGSNAPPLSLRQKLSKGEIQAIEWISKDFQLADCLTKLEAPTSKLIEVLRGRSQF